MNINVYNLMFVVAVVGFFVVTIYFLYRFLRGRGKEFTISDWCKKVWDLFWGM
ncbi:hypothetical protein GLE_1864 [Lysobacter enzymogenes]|uniref:Uncharacterized protein n=1 Tax=Lysobacter enzymogenes TaxID=69 RepID=A0A0S2DFL4_LYSEN|nr:hypothetical protein GLE_1864 [Lysobacter enzymogenes]